MMKYRFHREFCHPISAEGPENKICQLALNLLLLAKLYILALTIVSFRDELG